ncbi:hypothetical protein DRJ16_05820 [Candidatus Woesearchaeota archaeon]|nr:MAG: hypothetical protein DRJ16_05820 [Candidatus Woesearchaeota archaeon]
MQCNKYEENKYEKPVIKPFLQNTLNPSELEKLAEHFPTGWTVRYNTVQASVQKRETPQYKLIGTKR